MRILAVWIVVTGWLMGSSILPKYYEKELENGLKIVAIPMHNNTSVISTDIFYNVGSKDEVMGKSGIAHMLEHMNFKSTKNLKAGEFDKIVKSFGGVDNASTGFDYTHYFIKSSKQNLSKSLELFAEVMQNLNLSDEEFQTERDVVAEERRWRTDNSPMGYLYFRLYNNAFLYHPYHWTPIGFSRDIANWGIEDIKQFHKSFYQPQNAIIVVAGDIDKEEVFSEATKHFASIKNRAPLPKRYQVEPKQDGAKRIMIHKESDVEMVAIAYHIPNFQHKDQIALSAISELLSSGRSSRLYNLLINEKRLVNSIYAYNSENSDPNLFIFLATCNVGVKAEDAQKEILAEIERIKSKDVQQSELEKLKISTKSDFVFSLEESSSVANLFGSYLIRGDIAPLFSYQEDIEKLDTKSIKAVANRYFQEDNSVTVILRRGKNE